MARAQQTLGDTVGEVIELPAFHASMTDWNGRWPRWLSTKNTNSRRQRRTTCVHDDEVSPPRWMTKVGRPVPSSSTTTQEPSADVTFVVRVLIFAKPKREGTGRDPGPPDGMGSQTVVMRPTVTQRFAPRLWPPGLDWDHWQRAAAAEDRALA
jgi:hypothetical protein